MIDKILLFWEKDQILTREVYILKLEELYDTCQDLQTNLSLQINAQIKSENVFVQCFDEFFNITQADALLITDINIQFLINQR